MRLRRALLRPLHPEGISPTLCTDSQPHKLPLPAGMYTCTQTLHIAPFQNLSEVLASDDGPRLILQFLHPSFSHVFDFHSEALTALKRRRINVSVCTYLHTYSRFGREGEGEEIQVVEEDNWQCRCRCAKSPPLPTFLLIPSLPQVKIALIFRMLSLSDCLYFQIAFIFRTLLLSDCIYFRIAFVFRMTSLSDCL